MCYTASMRKMGLDFSTSWILLTCNKSLPSMVAGSVLGDQQLALYLGMLMSRTTLPFETRIINFNFFSLSQWQLKLEFKRLGDKEGI